MTAPAQQPDSRTIQWMVWGGLGFVILAIVIAFVRERAATAAAPAMPVLGEVGQFQLTDQADKPFTRESLAGNIWVADIIFTRCPGPCAQMTRHLKELQTALTGEKSVRFLSLTTDPEYDTPKVLREYATKFGADPARWQFATGSKAEIARLAIDSLKLIAVEQPPEKREAPEDLFIHSTTFVLVDRHGRLRYSFETTGADGEWQQNKERIVAAAKLLARER